MADNTNSRQSSDIDLQRHAAIQDARISNLETKFEMFMQSMKETTENLKEEMKDFKDEMRDRDNRRAAENEEIRQSIKEIYQTTDAKIDSIRQSIQSMQNQNIFVIIGVVAIAVAVFLK